MSVLSAEQKWFSCYLAGLPDRCVELAYPSDPDALTLFFTPIGLVAIASSNSLLPRMQLAFNIGLVISRRGAPSSRASSPPTSSSRNSQVGTSCPFLALSRPSTATWAPRRYGHYGRRRSSANAQASVRSAPLSPAKPSQLGAKRGSRDCPGSQVRHEDMTGHRGDGSLQLRTPPLHRNARCSRQGHGSVLPTHPRRLALQRVSETLGCVVFLLFTSPDPPANRSGPSPSPLMRTAVSWNGSAWPWDVIHPAAAYAFVINL
jgi:hypothetical protein